jgi:hypothetical protein
MVHKSVVIAGKKANLLDIYTIANRKKTWASVFKGIFGFP